MYDETEAKIVIKIIVYKLLILQKTNLV